MDVSRTAPDYQRKIPFAHIRTANRYKNVADIVSDKLHGRVHTMFVKHNSYI